MNMFCANMGGVYQGDDMACMDIQCPQPGACCFANGNCLPAEQIGDRQPGRLPGANRRSTVVRAHPYASTPVRMFAMA